MNFAQKQCDDEPALLMVKTCELTQRTRENTKRLMLNEEKVWPDLEFSGKQSGCDWYLDSGASNHMSGDKIVFAELDEKIVGTVRFGDDSHMEICGREPFYSRANLKNTK